MLNAVFNKLVSIKFLIAFCLKVGLLKKNTPIPTMQYVICLKVGLLKKPYLFPQCSIFVVEVKILLIHVYFSERSKPLISYCAYFDQGSAQSISY